jgi:hypothetical protein
MNLSDYSARYPASEGDPDRMRAGCTAIRCRNIDPTFRENKIFLVQSPVPRFSFYGKQDRPDGVMPPDPAIYPVTQQQWIILMNNG